MKEVGDITWVGKKQSTPLCLLKPPQPARTGRGQEEVEEEEEEGESRGVQRGGEGGVRVKSGR